MSIDSTESIDIVGAVLAELPPLVEETPVQEICRILDQLVKEKGSDYVYPFSSDSDNLDGDCRYVDYVAKDGGEIVSAWLPDDVEMQKAVETTYDMEPSCIVGHLVHRAGVPLEHLLGANTDSIENLWESYNFMPQRWNGSENEKIRAALSKLQSAQDVGTSWGDAVARFKKTMNADA